LRGVLAGSGSLAITALERQQQIAVWKARGREGRTRLKMKRGET